MAMIEKANKVLGIIKMSNEENSYILIWVALDLAVPLKAGKTNRTNHKSALWQCTTANKPH